MKLVVTSASAKQKAEVRKKTLEAVKNALIAQGFEVANGYEVAGLPKEVIMVKGPCGWFSLNGNLYEEE